MLGEVEVCVLREVEVCAKGGGSASRRVCRLKTVPRQAKRV